MNECLCTSLLAAWLSRLSAVGCAIAFDSFFGWVCCFFFFFLPCDLSVVVPLTIKRMKSCAMCVQRPASCVLTPTSLVPLAVFNKSSCVWRRRCSRDLVQGTCKLSLIWTSKRSARRRPRIAARGPVNKSTKQAQRKYGRFRKC
jgi:hypothetical protein